MTKPRDSEPARTPGTRPPVYVIVVDASDWYTDRSPNAPIALSEVLRFREERPSEPDPEPDLEAEP